MLLLLLACLLVPSLGELLQEPGELQEALQKVRRELKLLEILNCQDLPISRGIVLAKHYNFSTDIILDLLIVKLILAPVSSSTLVH